VINSLTITITKYTSYFIDSNWNLREVLIDFSPIYDDHTGQKLCEYLLQSLQQAGISNDRVLCITTDNGSNNGTMVKYLNEAITMVRHELNDIVRAPCLAHVIQLAVKALLTRLRISARNEAVITVWKEGEDSITHTTVESDTDSVPKTLKKVS
jgi:hypothetical protein